LEVIMSPLPAWLETAVFYQIYPQSFYDSNGDGIGDLPGVIQKLPYLKELGITAFWLNPCFVSPFQDAGYDVADYYQVAPRYGTNDDLRRLFEEAGKLGLRVLLDLVPGHTSIENAWFKESARHTRNEYSDWYVWTNSAWEWDAPGLRVISGLAERDASYITNFFYFQPALNYGFANPDPGRPWQQPPDAPGPRAVRNELKKIMRFWLEMGASGFRVDMAGSLVKQDNSGRFTAQIWQELRAWLDEAFPEAVLLSEWGQPKVAIPGGFHLDFTLPFGMPGYISLFRKAEGPGPGGDPYGASYFEKSGRGNIRQFMDNYLDHYTKTRGLGHIAIPSGNHDTGPRLSWGRDTEDITLAFLFLMTMPGTPFIYYGDEIGMREVRGLPSKEGSYDRTRLRTPMQWDSSANAGFSSAPAGQLYLPIDPASDRPTVAAQRSDPEALFNRVRRLIALRKAHPALCASGEFELLHVEGGGYPLIYRRRLGDETLLVAINPAERPCDALLPMETMRSQPVALYGPAMAWERSPIGWRLKLTSVTGGVYQVRQ
jgi:maltose alpha-D-glucosyltransferase/alpha-amylase